MSDDNKIEVKSDGPGASNDRHIMSATDRFKKSEISRSKSTATQPVLKPQKEGDPLSLRDSDTTKLKKIKPKSSNQTLDVKSNVSTDTVQLKVIKEKKKQLAGILTASQTIRLRPPSETETASSQTLKLSASDASQGSGTLKVKMPNNSSESGTIKVNKPGFTNSSSGTLKIKSATSGAGGTLKLKAGGTSSGGGTLKIKSSGVSAPVEQVESSSHSTKTSQAPKAKSSKSTAGAQAGVLMTISSIAAAICLGVAGGYGLQQFFEIYGG